MQINVQNIQNIEKITLKIIYEQTPTKFECNINEILENVLIKFANENNLAYKSIYFLYSGSSLFPTQIEKPISEIITLRDKTEKIMQLLAYQLELDIIQEDEIIIILSIESVKIVKLTGKKGEKMKDIIKDSIKLDLNWCTFKYKNNEIDLEQKFDDIADGEDKRQLKIDFTVNYTIPLIVNFVSGKKIYSIQCLLRDRINDKIDNYFSKKKLDSYDYDLYYENKIFVGYYSKIFYEIISEDKINNSICNDNADNNTKESFPTIENLNDSNQINFNFNIKEKKIVLPINEKNNRKIEIEIKIILKSCSVRYKRKISKCCNKFKDCVKDILHCSGYIIGFALGLFIAFIILGGWIVFV